MVENSLSMLEPQGIGEGGIGVLGGVEKGKTGIPLDVAMHA